MKDEVIPQSREGDVSTRHVHYPRKVSTIKKFAVNSAGGLGGGGGAVNFLPGHDNTLLGSNRRSPCKWRISESLPECLQLEANLTLPRKSNVDSLPNLVKCAKDISANM